MTNTKRLPRARGGEFQTATPPRIIQWGNPQRSELEIEIPVKIKPKTENNIEITTKLPRSVVRRTTIGSTQQGKPQNGIIQPKEEASQKILPKSSEPQRVITPEWES